MSTNAPEGIKAPNFHTEKQKKDRGTVFEQQAAYTSSTSSQDAPALVTYDLQESQRTHTLHTWSWLLIIICLGSLGSFSLVPYIFPDLIHTPKFTQQRPASVRPSSTIIPTPTPAGPFTESECTATSQQMKYLPTSGVTDNPTLPMPWLLAKRSQQDLANAQACAASFIIAYESFDSTNLQTLETCVSLLTDSAKQRFYGHAPNTHADPHIDPMWQANIQEQQVQQKAQVGEPGLLASQYTNGKLLVWMVVPTQLTILMAGSKPIVENDQFTVLLVGVPVNVQGTGTGWQVSLWQEGSTQFAPPALL